MDFLPMTDFFCFFKHIVLDDDSEVPVCGEDPGPSGSCWIQRRAMLLMSVIKNIFRSLFSSTAASSKLPPTPKTHLQLNLASCFQRIFFFKLMLCSLSACFQHLLGLSLTWEIYQWGVSTLCHIRKVWFQGVFISQVKEGMFPSSEFSTRQRHVSVRKHQSSQFYIMFDLWKWVFISWIWYFLSGHFLCLYYFI